MMKNKENISTKIQHIKENYKVPEGYFENLSFKKENTKTKIIRFPQKLMLVAGILLILVVGYVLNTQKNTKDINNQSITNVVSGDDALNNLTDDDIIEYLLDNDISFEEL